MKADPSMSEELADDADAQHPVEVQSPAAAKFGSLR
jgi:hypothetical protein